MFPSHDRGDNSDLVLDLMIHDIYLLDYFFGADSSFDVIKKDKSEGLSVSMRCGSSNISLFANKEAEINYRAIEIRTKENLYLIDLLEECVYLNDERQDILLVNKLIEQYTHFAYSVLNNSAPICGIKEGIKSLETIKKIL